MPLRRPSCHCSSFGAEVEPLPASSDPKAVEEMVPLLALGMAKTALYELMREEGVGRAELARRLRCHLPEVSSLLYLRYASGWSTSKRLSQRSSRALSSM